MKYAFLPFLFLFQIGFCQQDSLVDSRDGEHYSIIEFEGLKWMGANLLVKNNSSFCEHKKDRDGLCENGNFYSNQYLDQLCPTDWRLPTIEEWRNYFDSFGLDINNKKQFKTVERPNGMLMVRDKKKAFNFLPADNVLNLKGTGWVEGERLMQPLQTTYWATDSISGDTKTHVHISKHLFVVHGHKHNIEDKKEKVRRFGVRCVCEL